MTETTFLSLVHAVLEPGRAVRDNAALTYLGYRHENGLDASLKPWRWNMAATDELVRVTSTPQIEQD